MARFLLIFFSLFFISTPALASGHLVIEGHLTDSTGTTAIEEADVDFVLRVYHDSGKTCLLYEESHSNLDMSNTQGFFGLNLGNGSATIDPNSGLYNIFNNSVTNLNCDGAPPVNPTQGDSRYLEISYDTNNSGTFQVLQQVIEIGASAYAIEAEKVGGLSASDLIQSNTTSAGLSQANLEAVFDNSVNQAELFALLAGSSSQYAQQSANGAGSLPSFTTASPPSSPQAGDIWLNSTTNEIMYYDGASSHSLASGGGDLQSDGSVAMSGSLDLNSNFITNLADPTMPQEAATKSYVDSMGNSLAGSAVDSSTLSALSAGNSGEVLTWNGAQWTSSVPSTAPVASVFGRTGAVVSAASDYDANQIDNTPAGNISSADVQSAINELDAEKFNKAGDNISGALTMDNQNEIRFGDADNSDHVGFRAPPVVTTSMVWDLPSADGTSGQVLQTNGGGSLSWVSPSVAASSIGASEIIDGSITAADLADAYVNLAGDTMTGDLNISANINITNGSSRMILPDGSVSTPSLTFGGSMATGLSSPGGSNNLAIITNGTERMRINNAGFVGLGTNTPGSLLDVNGDGVFSGNVTVNDLLASNHISAANTLDVSNLHLGGNVVSTPNDMVIHFNQDGSAGTEAFRVESGSTPSDAFKVYQNGDVETFGYVKIATSAAVCTGGAGSNVDGAIRYVANGSGELEICDGSMWKPLKPMPLPADIHSAVTNFDVSANPNHSTAANCGGFTITGAVDGGEYTILVNGTTAATCTFAISPFSTIMQAGHGSTLAGKRRIYKIKVIGSEAFVTWDDFG